jgi:hypothetical protein
LSSTTTNINNNNPQKLNQDYTYNPEEEVATTQEQEATTSKSKSNVPAETELYSQKIKDLAQLKAFTVEFIDGTKKVYRRRKASMGEVADAEEKKQTMFESKGTPKQKKDSILNYYSYASSIHLRETRNNGIMTPSEVQNTVFEDFKQIIDACEYASIFNPN